MRVFNKKIFSTTRVKIFGLSLTVIGAILVLPFILIGVTSALLFLGQGQLARGRLSSAEKVFSLAKSTSKALEVGTWKAADIPLVGPLFFSLSPFSEILVRASELGGQTVLTANYSLELLDKILGEEVYDVNLYSQRIALEANLLYEDLGFLQGEIDNLGPTAKAVVFRFLGRDDLAKAREKVFWGKRIAEELPGVLGYGGQKTYLVLFQNNMELRPTGGFIGSFALVSFDSGRLSDISVSDVYAADGQLKGHVEPPLPIKNYLGEANWFLRDSNWDPDFSLSAIKAEWFLDKEIDVSVDGVVAIDLELVKKVLKEVGPVTLVDFEKKVDHDNLYELTQKEVERDFFPGSQRKRNFLTALARELVVQTSELVGDDYPGVARAIFESLEEKHLQVFLHNLKAQAAVEKLGWGGTVFFPKCSGNCSSDWLGIVEANVGVNKANSFVKRSATFETFLGEGSVKRYFTIIYKNEAEPNFYPSQVYKTFVRVLGPGDATFGPVEVSSDISFEVLEPEVEAKHGYKQAGVLVEVSPGETKSVRFYWQGAGGANYGLPGEHLFYWRKQAGTLDDRVVAKFSFPKDKKVFSDPPFSLTGGKVLGYNIDLSRDFVSRIYWP